MNQTRCSVRAACRICGLPVAGEAGVVPYVYVPDIDEAMARAPRRRGVVSVAPYPEGPRSGG